MIEQVTDLSEYGIIDINERDINGNNYIHILIMKGDIKTIKNNIHLFNIESYNYNCETFFLLACKVGNIKIVKFLHSLKADINAHDGIYRNAIHLAVTNDHHKLLKYLIKLNIDVNFQDRNGDTALHIAARNSFYKCVDVLMDSNIDISIKNKEGKNPFLQLS